jgi:hypothetical protein
MFTSVYITIHKDEGIAEVEVIPVCKSYAEEDKALCILNVGGMLVIIAPLC